METCLSVAALVRRPKAVLLARRKPGGDMGDRWELPGGKREGNESSRDALRREIREEFGISCRIKKMLAQGSFLHQGKHHRLKVFHVELSSKDICLEDHSEYRWFSLKRLPRASEVVDSDRKILEGLGLSFPED